MPPDEPPDEPPPGMLTPPGILTPPPPGIPEPLLPPLISIEEQPVTRNAAATAPMTGLAICTFSENGDRSFMVFASGDCMALKSKSFVRIVFV
jgi:hypothetical protein